MTDWFGADSRARIDLEERARGGPQDLDKGRVVVRVMLEGAREGKAKRECVKGFVRVFITWRGLGVGGAL